MIEIYVNGTRVKLDGTQAIALNIENFDIKDISNRKVTYTNNFKIPVRGNSQTFGFIEMPQSVSTLAYSDFAMTIVSSGLVLTGRGRLVDVSDGYYNVIFNMKPDVLQAMREYSLATATGLAYDISTVDMTTQLYKGTGSAYKMDILYNEWQKTYAETNANKYLHDYRTSYLTRYVKHIFKAFEASSGYTFSGGLWTDSYFEDLRVVVHQHSIRAAIPSVNPNRLENVITVPDATFYDLFREVLKIFCGVFKVNGTVISIEKFDLLNWTAPVLWDNRLVKVNQKLFEIPGTAQNNKLRYSAQDGATPSLNEVNMPCNNINLPYETELININASVYPFLDIGPYFYHSDASANARAIYLPDKNTYQNYSSLSTYKVSTNQGVSKFVFVCNGADTVGSGFEFHTFFKSGTGPAWTDGLQQITYIGAGISIATYYNSVNDYIRIAAMLQNPVFYEVEMNLSALDMQSFDPFNLVRIPELNGNFYVNSIKNYLLTSNKNTATIELIKIS